MSSLLLLFLFLIIIPLLSNPSPSLLAAGSNRDGMFSIFNYPDYDYPPPPRPPPPPPAGPAISCAEGLGGSGDFDTLCELKSGVALSGDVYIKGVGSLSILPGVILSCPTPGCSISALLGREVRMGRGSAVVAGDVQVVAANVSIAEGAVVNATALGGDPPEKTSGTGSGTHGDGGGHGGRGASCYVKDGDTTEDSWGGDVYAWDSLMKPTSYGSKGGTTSLEMDYGGGGGGRVMLEVKDVLEVDGVICTDGGDGGRVGGGGSGGSIYIVANKM